MTASSTRRKRSTVTGAIAGALAIGAVVAVGMVAFVTLRSSEEGRAPETDDREVVSFPSTPNAVIAVVDDLDRLTSLAVLTLDPSGVGGSIAPIPVNADRTSGLGVERLPVSREPFTPGDADREAHLLSELEPLLTLTIERVAIMGPDELSVLLEPLGEVEAVLPERVIDTDTAGTGLVVRDGDQRLDTDTLVEAFTAIDGSGDSYSHHDVDVALWQAVADAAGDGGVEVAVDEFDRPVAPADFDALWARLVGGTVASRAVAVDVSGARSADNEADADFVLVDRRDALLVFGSVSPGLVSKPYETMSFSLVAGFDEDAVAGLGDEASGAAITKTSMIRRFVGEMFFAQANVVAVQLADNPAVVPAVTRVEITDARFEAQVRAVSERFFGEADVVLADTVIDGVDAVVYLGADFLTQRAELLETERDAAEADAESDGSDGVADFDVSDDVSNDDEPVSTDTVPVDE